MKILRLLRLILFSIIPVVVFTVVKKFYMGDWYSELSLPSFFPSDLIFISIYFAVSIFGGIALYFIWKDAIYNSEIKKSYLRFLIPFILSLSWPPILFILQELLFVTVVLGVITISWIFVILKARQASKRACKFLVPNFLWNLFLTIVYALVVMT